MTSNMVPYFDEVDLPVRIFDRLPSFPELSAEWCASPVDALITGTSHYEPFDDHQTVHSDWYR